MPEPQNSRDLPPAALAALSQGKKIEAIKVVRQQWGLGLKEAKDAVEVYLRTRPDLVSTMQGTSAATSCSLLWLIVLVLAGVVVFFYLRER